MILDILRLPPLGYSTDYIQGPYRAFSKRWLTALILLATVAAALIFGALRTLGSQVHFAAAPAFFRRAPTNASRRSDPLRIARHSAQTGIRRSRVEQLDDTGAATTHFTHVVAHLAGFSAAPIAATTLAIPPQTRSQTLPREILLGSATAAFPATASSFAPSDDEKRSAVAEGEPINVSSIAEVPPRRSASPRVIVARSGDTLPRILQILGTAAEDVEVISSLLSPHGWLRSPAFTGGEKITVLSSDAGKPQTAIHPLKVSIERQGRKKIAVARTDAGSFAPVIWPDDTNKIGSNLSASDTAQLRTSTDESIRDGLYAMAQANGFDHTLIDEIVRLSGRDVNLDDNLSANDTLEMLYSTNDLGEPELAFSALTLDGHTHRYYRFTAPDDSSTDYYDPDGHSVTQSLLRKPVAAGHLGDGFGWRIHPVLGDRRLHQGVDYAAPFGSPIAAAGAGVIEAISQETGYGKYVRIRHDLGYETTYAHLSGVPHGLHVGERVRQGQVIAFVGSTGYSTGPHLYYEVRINGRNVDPLRIRLRAGRVLDGAMLTAFAAKRDRTDLLLSLSTARDDPG